MASMDVQMEAAEARKAVRMHGSPGIAAPPQLSHCSIGDCCNFCISHQCCGHCQAEHRGDVMQAAAAEAVQATASLRERQRAAIATPGRSTPAHTPRRTFGL